MKTELPGLQWEVTRENYERAIPANESTCIHADAIRERYPEYSYVKVNVATIQVSDKKRGVRYLYLTPSSVAQMLLFFDQGWREEKFPRQFRVRQPVKIIPIVRPVSDIKAKAVKRAARLTELEAKEQSGESLTSDEKRSLNRLQKPPKKSPVRPTSHGPSKAAGDDAVIGGPGKSSVVNANLIHERNRHFGAKIAQPSEVFKQAVEEAVAEDRAKRGESAP